MNTGQAPSLMLDLAASHMRDRRRAARGLVSRASLRRQRPAKAGPTRAR